ncbi:MAG: thiamine diphosphokinase [Chloroflexi bacterium]|nr:thiamine diphosphokinase [Chloroflexota bacterium]MBI3339045.1 thiamine diphosphokinase [Chloroflexota bacterium]
MSRIIIFANGQLPDIEKARALVQPDDYILCADGGTRHALALGLTPHLVIGDMDSVTKNELSQIEKNNIPVELYPRDKNETDLELALRHALDQNPSSIVIVGALGGRLDQTLGNLSLLSNLQFSTLDCRLDDGLEEVFFCRARSQVRGRSGDLVSLIPWREKVAGVQTKNLKWSLRNETLYPEKTRGISNEMTGDAAEIEIESGLLLVIHRRQ